MRTPLVRERWTEKIPKNQFLHVERNALEKIASGSSHRSVLNFCNRNWSLRIQSKRMHLELSVIIRRDGIAAARTGNETWQHFSCIMHLHIHSKSIVDLSAIEQVWCNPVNWTESWAQTLFLRAVPIQRCQNENVGQKWYKVVH